MKSVLSVERKSSELQIWITNEQKWFIIYLKQFYDSEFS